VPQELNVVSDNQNLAVVISELNSKIEMLLERQEEMAQNVAKIKEAIYNPDQGLYARLRELENWKQTYSRLQWIIITSIIALTTGALWNVVTSVN
jgi:archaellum component FlaC